jgi:mono/diheme cytochrome c family protein
MRFYMAFMAVGFLILGGLIWAHEHTEEGRQAFLDKNCNMCHAVETADIEARTRSEAMLGPDLAREARELTDQEMTAYLKRETDLEGKRHPRAFVGTDEELNAIVAWVQHQQRRAAE